MTNSAKQTKKGNAAKKVAAAAPEGAVPAYATGEFWSKALSKHPALAIGLVLLLAGWFSILHANHYHLTTPVIMLWFGWAGVIATARFLWWAGIAMASDAATDASDMDVSASRLRELLDEKKILVRAIKEIEFDRDLGKMSAEDAKDVMRFYRARAIEVIKEIDGQDESDMTVPQRIERDLQARLAVETRAAPPGKATPQQRAALIKAARANAKAAADAKTAAEEAESDDAKSDDAKADDAKSDDAESDDAKADDAKADAKVDTADAKADTADAKADTADAKAKAVDEEFPTEKPKLETPASTEDGETEAAESA